MSASRSRSHATSKHSSNPLPSVSGAGTRSRSHGSRSRSGVSPGLGGASPGGSHGGEPWERDKEGEEAGEIANQDAQDLTIHVIENAKDVLRIKMSHIESSFANALRRVMLAEVPTIAIDTVEVFCNDSVLHDEMLVHRLGLCPIQTIIGPPDNRVNVARKLVYPRDCSCSSYCHKCSITFDLHVRCVDSTRRTVTTHDFVNVVSREADADVQDVLIGSQVQPVHTPNSQDTYPIVIVELARGQEIKVRCIARKGIGKEHGRWNPACTVAMQFVPEINLNERAFAELAASDKARWIRFCPRKVYSFDKARNKVEVNAENVNACFFCDECTQVATEPFGAFKGKKQLVSVRRKKDPLGRRRARPLPGAVYSACRS
ncbi:DNA-directed RNA polymerase II subunit rpb3 [Diplonema papillatum]|nr:DNA-directed RNA polymerase II subunit rpb3 [Diplonema papillatum]